MPVTMRRPTACTAVLVVLSLVVAATAGWSQPLHRLPDGRQVGLGLTPTPPELLRTFLKAPRLVSKQLRGSADLSSQMPPAASQGSAGSCASWATTYYYKAFQEGKEQGWDFSSDSQRISPAFVYNLINGGSDGGTSFGGNFSILTKRGACSWQSMPYSASDCTTWPSIGAWREAMDYRAQSATYIFAFGNPADYIDDMKAHLDGGDVFVMAIPVYSDFYNIGSWPDYVYDGPGDGASYQGGHGICIVGYDDSKAVGGAFKFVNSWGSGWGQNGYAWLSYGFVGGYAWEAWKMTDRIAYTPQAVAEVHVAHPKHNQLELKLLTDGYSDFVLNNQGGAVADIYVAIDLTDALSYLPPSETQEWTCWVRDTTSGSSGQISLFEIEHGATTYSSSDPPVGIPDPGIAEAKISGLSGAKSWTFLVYLDADNNLEGAGIDDLNEMEQVGSTDDVNIVVQMDRISGYDTSNGNWTTCRRYYVDQDSDPAIINSTMLEVLGEVNMGDGETLEDFIEWGVANYPATRYAVVLWNHGGGWKTLEARRPNACCWDDTDGGDCLYTKEFGQAISDAGLPLAMVGFDVCLGGLVEIAYELSHTGLVSAMAASPTTEPSDGWDYTALLTALTATPGMDGVGLADAVVTTYAAFYPSQTMTSFDLSQMGAAATAVSDFATTMITEGDEWAVAGTARSGAQTYYYSYYRDLIGFLDGVATEASNAAVIAAANTASSAMQAMVSSYHAGTSYPNGRGIAVEFHEDGAPSAYTPANLAWAEDTQWDEFLDAYPNGPPSVAAVEITPDPAYTGDDLTATPSGWYDPDGDPEGYTWQWQRDTGSGLVDIAGATTDTLTHDHFARGDVVKVICTPEDGRARTPGTPVSDELTISDSPPSAPTVVITPAEPNSDDDLHCEASGSTAPDGDAVTYKYQWYKNGVIRPHRTWPNLAASRTSPGDEWRCVVTPTDGIDDGPPGEATVTINRPPTAPTVGAAPAAPRTWEALHCDASGSADPDGEAVTYKYQWHKNGVLRPNRKWPNIAPWRTRLGDEWYCVVTPTDGTDEGPAVESNHVVIVENQPPTAPTVVITPEHPTTDDSLRCKATDSTDPECDTVGYKYQWYKNGILQLWRVWPNVHPSRTSAGETWTCVVTPTDGFDDGPTGEASVLVQAVGGRLSPKATVIGCLAVQPTGIGAEIAFTLSGKAKVTAEIVNIAGRPVRLLVSERPMAAGANKLLWNGRNSTGVAVPAGVYLVRVRAAEESGAQAMAVSSVSLMR